MALACCTAACEDERVLAQPRPAAATATAIAIATEAPGNPAAERIARAECERKRRCGQLGDAPDLDSCVATTKEGQADGRPLPACTGAVDWQQVSRCVFEIKTQDCNDSAGSATDLSACRQSDLCLGAPAAQPPATP